MAQLQDMEFPEEEDFNGLDVENGILRRLYRVLNLPTSDFLHYKDKRLNKEGEALSVRERRIYELEQRHVGRCGKMINWMKKKIGIGRKKMSNSDIGFKPVQKKCLHFRSARFRESLMEIAMLCQETDVSNFVENLEDIQILFTSMSPAIVEFFENGYNSTRFTKKIKNLDWRLGDNL